MAGNRRGHNRIRSINRHRDDCSSRGQKKRGIHTFIRHFLITVAVLAALCMLIVYLLDPFYHYHAPWFGLKAVLNEKEYQVPGSLRHFDYDMVLAGSSVVENNDNHWFDEAFGGTTIKAVRSYGGVADLVWYLDLAFETHDVKRVFFNIDAFALTEGAQTTFAASGCPMYLYDRNPFNDVQYLLNREVLLEKVPYEVAESLDPAYDEGLSYNWAEGKNFSEEGVLSHYYRLKTAGPMLDKGQYEDSLSANLALLKAEVEAHPDTEFIFFFPPYSMIWWDDAVRHGMRDVYLYDEEQTAAALVSYENVSIYDFQNETSVTTDLNRYMDTIHFDPAVNQWMCEEMAERDPSYLLTEDNVGAFFARTRDLCDTYENGPVRELEEEGSFLYGEE